MSRSALDELRDRAVFWNVTPAERGAEYPCDRYAGPESLRALRGIDVDVPADLMFRWVCQIKVAPYSYDLIDNLGRRSPRALTPGVDQLAIGQDFMIGTIADFSSGEQITVVGSPRAEAIFGPLALTYLVRPTRTGSRLICCIWFGADNLVRRVLREPLLVGDLIMMRKQFRTLKACAEADAGRTVPQ